MAESLVLNWVSGSESLTNTVSINGELSSRYGSAASGITVPGSGNVVIDAVIDVSALSLVYIELDGTAGHTITLTTNDDGTPDDTFTLTVGKPLVWYTGCGLPNPFASAVDVTSMKAAKATAVNATLRMRFVEGDVTT